MLDKTLTLAAAFLTLGFVAGQTLQGADEPQASLAADVVDPTEMALEQANLFSAAVQSVAERVGPAVVGVRTYSSSSSRWRRPLRRGSGVIYDAEGWIVTNNHVVADAGSVSVSLADGRVLDARIVGTDPGTDLAVLKIDAEDLVAAEIGGPTPPGIGSWVLAMGNPRGLDLTVTMGIVSGTGRSDLGIADYEDFIQTDAAINPGNSGGALVDLAGNIVGINTAIGTEAEGSVGIGFAIPAFMIRPVVEDLRDEGRVRRGFLGVTLMTINSARAVSQSYEGSSRVSISRINAGGPADNSGLRQNDIIERVGERNVTDQQGLRNALAVSAPDSETPITVWRGGERLVVPVRLGERPTDQ